MPARAGGLLEGLKVLEIGRRIAASVVGMALAEQGAEVVRVTDTSLAPGEPVVDALLARGKTELRLDLSGAEGQDVLRRLAERADVVVENREPGALAAWGLDFDALRAAANPGLVSCSIPSFPAEDPRGMLPDHEAIVGTAGYLYEKPIGAPKVHPFPLGSVLGGLFAANGIVAALIARLRTGRGQHVSASLLHSDVFAQVVLVLMRTGIPRGFLPLKMVGTPFMGSWECGDGRYIYLHISLPAHNRRIMEILEGDGYAAEVGELRRVLTEETLRDPSQVKSIPEAQAIKAIYEGIFKSRPAQAWEELLGQELCCIKVRTVEEWLEDSHAAGMADAATVEDPVFGRVTGPGAVVTVQEHPPELRPRSLGTGAGALVRRWARLKPRHLPGPERVLEPDLRHPLDGIRVMDLSRVIAGPCAARVLAELGAEVLSVQSPTRLDWALSFHLLFNAGKKSVTLDFTGEEGKRTLWRLMEDFQPHAFIQNYRNMDLAREIGVGPEDLRRRFPRIAYTHLNAYGNLGIWRDRPGFEQVVQAVSGIQVTYGEGGRPKLLPTPVIDIGSGLLGAFGTLLGLYQQLRNQESVVVTTHLTRMAVLFQVEPVAASQRARCLAVARERGEAVEVGPEIVAGILRARDGRFCVAGPRPDVERWLAGEALLMGGGSGNPLKQVSRRVALRPVAWWRKTLEEAGLADRVGLLEVPGIKKMLEVLPRYQAAGAVPVVSRRDYSGVSSPLTFITNPIRLSTTPVKDVGPAPMRGEHTREVLGRLGASVGADGGVIPYPEAKPLLVWAATLVRWGYFAWRSGNI